MPAYSLFLGKFLSRLSIGEFGELRDEVIAFGDTSYVSGDGFSAHIQGAPNAKLSVTLNSVVGYSTVMAGDQNDFVIVNSQNFPAATVNFGGGDNIGGSFATSMSSFYDGAGNSLFVVGAGDRIIGGAGYDIAYIIKKDLGLAPYIELHQGIDQINFSYLNQRKTVFRSDLFFLEGNRGIGIKTEDGQVLQIYTDTLGLNSDGTIPTMLQVSQDKWMNSIDWGIANGVISGVSPDMLHNTTVQLVGQAFV